MTAPEPRCTCGGLDLHHPDCPAAPWREQARQVLTQVRARHWIDVLRQDGTPDHIHYNHVVHIESGSLAGNPVVQVKSYLRYWLLPISFPTMQHAHIFLSEFREAYDRDRP